MRYHPFDAKNTLHGFTLLEFALALIVIGLVIGGILVGQNLIQAAHIRATVRTYEELETAFITFKLKYGCLPGDCANAYDLGFDAYDGLSNPDGDGDGKITGDYMYNLATPNEYIEVDNALAHISQAGLFTLSVTPGEEALPAVLSASENPKASGWRAQYMYHPQAAGAAANIAGGAGHYFWSAHTTPVRIPAKPMPPPFNLPDTFPGAFLGTGSYYPADAYAIDTKIDDGLPRSGKMVANSGYSRFGGSFRSYIPLFKVSDDTGAPGAKYCITNETPNRYNISNMSGRDYSLCAFTIKAPF